MITPNSMAKLKPRSTSPPRKYRANRTKMVVRPVRNVRDSVWLIERSSSSMNGMALYLRIFSRTRSKTTTLSLIE